MESSQLLMILWIIFTGLTTSLSVLAIVLALKNRRIIDENGLKENKN